jgi:large subunit ribosomal protein L24
MFSTSWKSSKKPAKQVKYRALAPLHLKANFLHAHLSEELSKKFAKRAIRVRKGDKVKVIKGQFRGKSAKVEKVNTKDAKVYLEGIDVQKGDGTKVKFPIAIPNIMITEVTDDKRRFKRK